jgi:peptide/nickel transport system substrate-binding protein
VRRSLIPLVVLLSIAVIITGCSGTFTSPTTKTPAVATPGKTTTTTSTKPTPATTTLIPTIVIPPSARDKSGGIIRWIDSAAPATPIGWNAETSGVSVFSMQLCLQYLLKEQMGGKITPNLAESYDVITNPDSPSITFHLRKGVKFHDGSDFNAAAVKWNFEKTKAGGMTASTTNFWISFDIIDDYTFRVNLSAWYNRLIRGFADGVAYVVSPTAYEKNGLEWMRWNMVGTGPFTQKSFARDIRLDVVKNPNYYEQDKPYLDGVQVLYVSDEMTRVALFKSGGAEVLNLAGAPRYASELEAEGFNIISQPSGATVLVPDSGNADSPWSNIKVRTAADYALDREAIASRFGYGYYTPAYQLNSPASMAHVASLPGRTYDVNKAKQLMTEAGYPAGFKTTIYVQNGSNMDVPVAVQSYLDKVGIKAEISVKEPAAYTQIATGTWKNALIMNPLIEWANPNTGFNFFWGVPGSWFKSLNKPAGWAEAITASNTSVAPDPSLTQKLETMAYDDAMVVPLFFGVNLWATTKNVQDSGIGTRGAGTWFEAQNAWLSK